MNTQSAVRAVLQGLGEASLWQIRVALQLTDPAGRDRVYKAIGSLKATGEAVWVKPAVYRYQEPTAKAPDKLGKIWRSIRAEKRFNVSDLQLLSGAETSYIQRFVKWLKENDYINETGRHKNNQKVYQVTSKATPACPNFTQKISLANSEKTEQLEQLTYDLLALVLCKDKKLRKKINEKAQKIVNLTGGKK